MLTGIQKKIQDLPLDKICRVVIMRDGFFGEKHLIVQFGDPKRSLSDYASHEEESHFNFAFGPVNKGLISGSMQTLPERWEFPNKRFNLGKVTVHIFVPEESQASETGKKEKDKENTVGKYTDIAQLVLHIPNAIHIQEHVKSLEQQLKDKEFSLRDMGLKLSAMATVVDVANAIIKGFRTEGGPKNLEDFIPKRIDLLDGICVFVFPVVFYFIVNAFGATPLIGVVVGGALACFVIYRRH
jgi:hypothetical protein